MTEVQWLQCSSIPSMLGYLRYKVTARKLRLFACACLRCPWIRVADPPGLVAVDVAEGVADVVVPAEKLWEFHGQISHASTQAEYFTRDSSTARALEWILHTSERESVVAVQVAYETSWVPNTALRGKSGRKAREEKRRMGGIQAELLRDIVGNPWHPVVFDNAWKTPTVRAVASAIYANRRFADMPILADALEEAGCTSAPILNHCRNGKDHVLGCWVVDCILERT